MCSVDGSLESGSISEKAQSASSIETARSGGDVLAAEHRQELDSGDGIGAVLGYWLRRVDRAELLAGLHELRGLERAGLSLDGLR